MASTGRSERSSNSTEQPELIDRSDSIDSEGTAKEGFPLSPTNKLGYGSSSSLNLLDFSDLVQVDANVNRPEAGTICLGNPPDHGMYQLQFKDNESDASSISSAKSEKSSGSQGPTSASQISDITLESVGIGMSPTQSPPLQTMDRVGEYESYDPFRIPSAVFQRSRSIAPLEWSIASNESLFSIHVGNNSFSRDHVLMLSELGKPTELTKSDELFEFNTPPAVITSRETERKSGEFEKQPEMTDIIKDKEGLVPEGLSERNSPPPAVSWNSSNKSRRSDRSQTSSDSFAFPIKKKCACPSCYCSNCSRPFCYYLWPRCYPTWPSCCCWNCSRAFCYCWNCSRKGLCCHTSNILADEEAQSGSTPADAKKKHQDAQGAAVPSKSTAKSWFPCCYSFPCCSCFSCCTWSFCSCSSCCKLNWCSCSSCCKWSCCSHSSCCKWNFRTCSCCKWNCRSCSSCCTWSCCSCRFRRCCHFCRCFHFRRCCHFCPSCHVLPSCHCC